MECRDIKEKLSVYIEDQLSSEEKQKIDEHLKTCSKCSSAANDLRKTIAYTRGLGEIEPPAWLAQKVMAKVKEEAGAKKGILQKLFYPLHVKVPVHVVATVAVAVITIYVFRDMEPMIKIVEKPLQEAVVSEHKEKMNEPAYSLPAHEPSARQAGTGKTHTELEKDELAKYAEVHRAPAPAEKQKAEAYAGKTITGEEPAYSASRIPAGEPEPMARETVRQETDQAPVIRKMRDSKEQDSALKYGLISQAVKEKAILSVSVKNLEQAVTEIEKTIKEFDGKIVKAEPHEDKPAFQTGRRVLVIEINSGKMKELRDRLKLIGHVKEQETSPASLKGNIEVKIEIIEKSEAPSYGN